MTARRSLVLPLAAAAALLLPPEVTQACAACFGAPDSPMTTGLSNAILALLAVIGLVQVGIVKVIWDIRKRSKNRPVPTELRLIGGGKS